MKKSKTDLFIIFVPTREGLVGTGGWGTGVPLIHCSEQRRANREQEEMWHL